MKSERYSLTILFFTMLVINTGFGVIMPILPYYAQELGASATTLGMLSATFAILQFFFAPMWGRLSDRIGRRPVLLIGLSGFSLSFLIFGLSTQLWMLFLSRMVSGILSSATLPTVLAFIADTTKPENRAQGMGLMGAAGGIGMIMGPAIGGFLGEISPQTPFFFSSGLALLLWIFAFLIVPETHPAEKRTPAAGPAAKQTSRLHMLVNALRGPMAFLMILAALTSFGVAQLESTGALFAKARFNAGEAEMGFLFMVMGATGVFTQFVLVGRVIKRIGERRAIQLSLLSGGLCFMMFGVIVDGFTAVITVILMGLTGAFLRPALNALVSRSAPPSEQGVAMGLINSFYSLGMVFGPITGGLIFDQLGIAWPFYSAGLIHIAALLASFSLFPRRVPVAVEQQSSV